MGWREQLERVTMLDGRKLIGASFRGFGFFVESNVRSGGRQAIVHEFANSDLTATDDNGKAPIDFRVEGYVIGDDYLAHRDALLDAIENISGPGELIHPYYGRVRVQAGRSSCRESTSLGGMAVISIEFHNSPIGAAPVSTLDLPAEVVRYADLAVIANAAELEEIYDVAGQPSFATTSLRGDIAGVAVALGEALAPVASTAQELALLSVEIDLIAADTAALVRAPADALASLLGALDQLADSIEAAPLRVVNALITTYLEPAPAAVLGDTATRIQERVNQAALGDALRRLLIIEASRLLPNVAFKTLEEATALRSTVVDAIDALAATAGNTAYPALMSLRSALLRAVPGDAVLARIQALEQKTAVPSLVLSYQLYGSTEMESDLIARNGIQHPGFIAGDLQVLSDD